MTETRPDDGEIYTWLRRAIKGEDIKDGIGSAPLAVRQQWRQFSGSGGFLDRYRPEWVDSDFTVRSDTYGYTGVADWIARIGGALVLGSWGRERMYPGEALRLAAIAHADYIAGSDGTEKPIPAFDRFAVLHIRPLHSRLMPIEHTDDWFRGFLGLKAVAESLGESLADLGEIAKHRGRVAAYYYGQASLVGARRPPAAR